MRQHRNEYLMPRARNKTPGPTRAGGYQGGGNPGGGVQSATAGRGLPYGERKDLVDSQKVVPIPQAPAAPAAPPTAQTPPAQAAPDGTPPNPMQAALQAALQATPPQGPGLTAPTGRPGENVMTGIGNTPNIPPSPGLDGQILANLLQAFKVAPSAGLQALIQQTEQLRGTVQ
jgi:hypothetical protein